MSNHSILQGRRTPLAGFFALLLTGAAFAADTAAPPSPVPASTSATCGRYGASEPSSVSHFTDIAAAIASNGSPARVSTTDTSMAPSPTPIS